MGYPLPREVALLAGRQGDTVSGAPEEHVTNRPWEAMTLRHVGDVGEVMRRKSGRRHDPSVGNWRRKKRGAGGRD